MTKTVWLVDVAYVVKASQGIFKLDYIETERFLAENWLFEDHRDHLVRE